MNSNQPNYGAPNKHGYMNSATISEEQRKHMGENSFDIQNAHNNSFANYTHHNLSHFAEPSYTSS